MMMGKGNMNMASWTSNVDSSNSSDGWGSFGKVSTTRSGDDYVSPWTSEADWVCMMCNHRNRATNEVCGGAGPEGCKAPKACSHSSPAFQPPSDSSTMGANVTGVPGIMSSSSSDGMSSNSSSGRLSQEQMMQQMMMQQQRPMQQNRDPNMVMGVPGIMSSSSSNGMNFNSSNGGMPQDPNQMQQMMMMQQSQMQPNMDPKMMNNMMGMMMTMMQQMGTSSPWKCVCGFKNVARNTVCGGKGEGFGCKQPRPQQNMPMFNVSGKGGGKGRVATGPDWVCELCGFQNKSFNKQCGGSGRLGCKADKPIDVSQPWTCDACNEINDGSSTVCNATGCQKPRQARSQG